MPWSVEVMGYYFGYAEFAASLARDCPSLRTLSVDMENVETSVAMFDAFAEAVLERARANGADEVKLERIDIVGEKSDHVAFDPETAWSEIVHQRAVIGRLLEALP